MTRCEADVISAAVRETIADARHDELTEEGGIPGGRAKYRAYKDAATELNDATLDRIAAVSRLLGARARVDARWAWGLAGMAVGSALVFVLVSLWRWICALTS